MVSFLSIEKNHHILLVLFLTTIIILAAKDREEVKLRFERSLSVLQNALNEHKFTTLKPLLAENFRIDKVPQTMNMAIIKTVVNSYSYEINELEITKITSENELFRVETKFYTSQKNISYDFLMTAEGKFVEINIFQTSQKITEKIPKENLHLPILMQADFELAGNLICVKAKIDGSEGNFLIDSGAPNLVLNSRYFSGDKNNSVAGMGISGTIVGADLAHVNNFEWNEFSMRDFDALNLDISHLENALDRQILGLIGFQELQNFEIIYDYQKQEMILYQLDEAGEKISNEKWKEPDLMIDFTMSSHIPVLQGQIENVFLNLGLDTGAESNLIDAKYERYLIDNFEYSQQDTLRGADQNFSIVSSGKIDGLQIGEMIYNDVITVFSKVIYLKVPGEITLDGLIGYEFLSRQKTAINYRKKQISLWND